MAKKELNEVFLLRGVASLMVCLFHLVLGNGALFPSTNPLEQVFSYGYLGVEVFFILSGYVICYSLPAGFNYSHLRTFFLKRLVRIEPPYVVSIVLVLVLNYFSHRITGLSSEIEVWALIGHLAYVNNFIPDTYVNVVYWTLGIEAQFYLLIGFLFPVLKLSRFSLLVFSALFLLVACIPSAHGIYVILPYLAYFTLGISLFFYKIKRQLSLPLFLAVLFFGCLQLQIFQGTPGTIAAICTVVILLFWNKVNRTIRFFSSISFSLYLTHVPVGGKVINLGMRFTTTDLSRYALVFVAAATSIGFAYLFYKYIELPAFRISKKIRYPLPESVSPVGKPIEPVAEKENQSVEPILHVRS